MRCDVVALESQTKQFTMGRSRYLWLLAVIACAGSPAGGRPVPREALAVVAQTGPAELVAGPGQPLPAYTAEEYAAAAEMHRGAFVQLHAIPPGLSAAVRFGFNVVIAGKNVSWLLDGDPARGFSLIIDRDADGDATDEIPVALVASKHGHRAVVELRPGNFVRLSLVANGRLFMQEETIRRGALRLSGRDVMFAVRGSDGVYNWAYHKVWFDLDGDGSVATSTTASPEIFQVREKYVSLLGSTWEFRVAKNGSTMTLVPAAPRPPRPSLSPGAHAPDFSFSDPPGTKRLSDLRGKVVLIDFWTQYCGPCVEAAPRLAGAYARFHERGFEIIGVTADHPQAARSFIAAHGHVWSQVFENEDGPVGTLYRVNSYPSYFLLDREGIIRCSGVDCLDEQVIARLLSAQ